MDHGSYMMITEGMSVKGTEGHLGSVVSMVGDINMDVFRGIMVSHGIMGKHTFIPSDVITGVTDHDVEVNLSHSEFDRLPSEAPVATSPTGKLPS